MLRRFENFSFVDISVSSDTSCNKVSIRDLFDGRRDAPVLDGVTYVTSVMSHGTGEPNSTRLFAREIRVFARRASSTEWKEVLEFNVPPEVTSAAVVASRNRGVLLIGTVFGLHAAYFRLDLDGSSGNPSQITLEGTTPRELANKLDRTPVAGQNAYPTPLSGSPYVVKVDAAMTRRGPVEIIPANTMGLTAASGSK